MKVVPTGKRWAKAEAVQGWRGEVAKEGLEVGEFKESKVWKEASKGVQKRMKRWLERATGDEGFEQGMRVKIGGLFGEGKWRKGGKKG